MTLNWLSTPIKMQVNPLRVLLLLMVLSVGLGVLRFNTIPVGSFFDDAHYLVLSESLLTGRGYNLINFPTPVPEKAFPPGWALLLMPITAVFPANLQIPKLLPFALWIASIPLIYRLFAPRLPHPYNIALVALVALNPHLIGMAVTVMSEAAFLFFALLTLVCLTQWYINPPNPHPYLLAGVLLLAGFTMLIRSIGLAMVLGILLYLLLKIRHRHFSAIATFSGVLIVSIVVLLGINLQQGGSLLFSSGYNTHLSTIFGRLGEFFRVWEHTSAISPETLANGIIPIFELQAITQLITPLGSLLISLAVLLMVACGFVLSLPRYQPTELFVFFYLAIFYFWIVYIDTVQPRLVIPLIPFFYFYLLQAFVWLEKQYPKTTRQLIPLVIVGICMLSLIRNGYTWLNPIRDRVVDLSIGTTWLQQNSPDTAVIMTPNPVPDYLYLRRLTIDYPRDGSDISTYLANNAVNYIILRSNLKDWDNSSHQLDTVAETQLLPFIQAYADQFQLVFQDQTHHITIYQVQPEQ